MPTRRYDSPVRDAQREATRERIIDAALELVAGGLDELTIPAVATSAGLSPATVYRHFPTLDDLMLALLQWLRPRVGQTRDRLTGGAPERLADVARENYAGYEKHADVLRPLMESRAFNRARVGSEGRRAPHGVAAFRHVATGYSEQDLEGATGAVYMLVAPQTWRWLRETWGLDAETASRATSWAVQVLVEAIANGRGLDADPARPTGDRP